MKEQNIVSASWRLYNYLWLVYLTVIPPRFRDRRGGNDRFTYVTALVPSEIACRASWPGRSNITAVCISREEMVWRFLCCANRGASATNRSMNKNVEVRQVKIETEQKWTSLPKMSLTKLFIIDMALLEIPVLGCTYMKQLSTAVTSFFPSHTSLPVSKPWRYKLNSFPFLQSTNQGGEM